MGGRRATTPMARLSVSRSDHLRRSSSLALQSPSITRVASSANATSVWDGRFATFPLSLCAWIVRSTLTLLSHHPSEVDLQAECAASVQRRVAAVMLEVTRTRIEQ